jgi:hypothetical protein
VKTTNKKEQAAKSRCHRKSSRSDMFIPSSSTPDKHRIAEFTLH